MWHLRWTSWDLQMWRVMPPCATARETRRCSEWLARGGAVGHVKDEWLFPHMGKHWRQFRNWWWEEGLPTYPFSTSDVSRFGTLNFPNSDDEACVPILPQLLILWKLRSFGCISSIKVELSKNRFPIAVPTMMMRCEVREPKTFDVSDASTVVSHVTVEFKKRPFGVLAYVTLSSESSFGPVFHGRDLGIWDVWK